MAFLIRTIDFTASGREIIRDRVVEQAHLTVGRAAECDIHLPDLAVEQRHLALTLASDGTLRAEALGTLGFALDGRSVTEGVIDPGVGGEIALGSALIAAARDEAGRVTLTIRQAPAEEGKGDAVAGFALASALPSKRAASWVLASLILVLLLAVPVFTHATRTITPNDPDKITHGQTVLDAAWSTGALSVKHHALEENCESCHVNAFVSVRDETCISCHKGLGDHAAKPRLIAGMPELSSGDAALWKIAGMFGKEGRGACTTCHTEHEGKVRQQPASEAFCSDCHDKLDTRLTDTALANAHDFGKQHPQFRPTFYAAYGAKEPVRLSLDKKPVEQSGLIFPHDVHMDERGGAARMAISLAQYGAPLECKDCHAATADKISFKPVEMEQSCESCHSLVSGRGAGGFTSLRHGDVRKFREDIAGLRQGAARKPVGAARQRPGQFGEAGRYYAQFGRPVNAHISLARGLEKGGVCTECHLPTQTGGRADLVPVNLPDRFLMHGYFSHEAHKKEECTDCHAADKSKTANDLLIPDLASCRDCHLGATAQKTKKIVPSSCAMCHAYHVPSGQWSQSRSETTKGASSYVADARRAKGSDQ
ncbi:MAG: cytochrome c family protein [Erythrobacter sp. SCN 62-14]|nr:MAG: cytochrome c family protein [Erythrobacter sp. SCN 62-14]